MKYIRVSEILARLQHFSNIDQAVLENKQEIGTRTHSMITSDAHGQEIEVADTCDRSRAYFNSYLKFKESFKPCYIMLESRMFDDELMITGECDAVCKTPEGLVLLDWKTSSKPNLKIWEMQAHFYWYLLNVNKIPIGNRMIWVNLRHKKEVLRNEDGDAILDDLFQAELYHYVAQDPKVYEFKFNTEIMKECMLQAELTWNEKRDNFDVD